MYDKLASVYDHFVNWESRLAYELPFLQKELRSLGEDVSQIRVMDWWVGYCTKTSQYGYNDAGDLRTPEKEKICGCS